jgi:hypothetical protein
MSAGLEQVQASHSGPLVGAAALQLLGYIQRTFDWRRLENVMDGLDRHGEVSGEFSDGVMLRALLLQQWFALGALEFDYELADRRSFQKFIGAEKEGKHPSYKEVNAFRRSLLRAGISPALERTLSLEFISAGLGAVPRPDLDAAESATAGLQLPRMNATPYIRPMEWLALEQDFFDQLAQQKSTGSDFFRIPADENLRQHFVRLDVIDGGRDFRWGFVGKKLTAANSGEVEGSFISEKISENIRRYGLPGIQEEFRGVFERSLIRQEPATTAAFYQNAVSQKRQLWITVAPMGDHTPARFLAGVCMIENL